MLTQRGLKSFYVSSFPELTRYILSNRNHIYPFLQYMRQKKCLPLIHKDLELLTTIEQNPVYHAEGDAFEHTALVCYHMDKMSSEVSDDVYVERMIASLFHDIGKVYTHTVNKTGIHHYGHEAVSTDIAKKFCEQLAIPSKRILFMISNHMRIQQILVIKKSKVKTLKESVYYEDLKCLALSDYYGAQCEKSNRTYVEALEKNYG